ncbi:MAG: hypothetical protein ABJM43_22150 [Paracoccaceae bacterium]|uniref:hypothetical protein n=1 Tax=Ascidiaceihabitans sp. TaxID=1872644 RepID=UPI00329A38B7
MPRQTDHRITLRLKPDEYARLQALAKGKPLSAYMRERVLGDGTTKRTVKPRRVLPDKKFAAQLLALLGPHDRIATFKKIANELDDGVRDSDDETKALICETRDWLKRIHALLMTALGVSEP